MTGRDSAEGSRASTPLELLFDLTFVVAVSQAAAALSHALVGADVQHAVVGYLMVFFAIWWAWMNFTWFASAYDTDDVAYRLLTLVQMCGALVLAAGVPAAFESDYTGVTTGYVVMRVAMVGQWTRAAISDESRRATAVRYAVGITVVQAGWVARLALPAQLGVVSFLLLAVAEIAVPLVSERASRTPWHPHHIAERYGLFTIIVLGECMLAATVALRSTVATSGWGLDRVLLGVGGLVMLFLLWWLYFLRPAGGRLERRPELVWSWSYGHYAVFAALAALGAALEATAATLGEADTHGSSDALSIVLAYAVAVPVALFLLVLWGLHAPLASTRRGEFIMVLSTCVVVLAIAATTSLGLPIAWCVILMCLPVAGLLMRVSVRTAG